MLRTIEALFVVVIVLSSLLGVLHFAVIPSPRETSGIGLEDLAASTLQGLDEDNVLTETIFGEDEEAWANLQSALEASLPPNIIYKLTAYSVEIHSENVTYRPVGSTCNFKGDFPSGSEATSYTVTSPNVTISFTPEKIGAKTGREITLYILNCEDANGWWITGYTGKTLASDVYNILSPYFGTTVLVNSTSELEKILKNETITSLEGEMVEEAVVINTFGEAVPIPNQLADEYEDDYAEYAWYVGQKVNAYNWTWVSIVGYPLYYVSNTEIFAGEDNTWGIYGMKSIGSAGFNGFLQGLDGAGFVSDGQWITESIGVVDFTSKAKEMANRYGIYPETYQTASRALPIGHIWDNYNVYPKTEANIFEPVWVDNPEHGLDSDSFYAGATFTHQEGSEIHGSFTAIGLARTPDIRVSVLGLLMFYRPSLIRSEFGVSGTNRIVVLQLGQLGGD